MNKHTKLNAVNYNTICRFCVTVLTDFRIGRPTGLAVSRHVSRPRHVSRHPTLRFLRKLFTFFRIGPYKLVDLCKWSAFVNNRTMRDNCSAAPRLQHCVEITSVSFTVSAVLSRSRLGLEGNCLGLVLVSADSENKCLCLVSVSNTNCLVSVSSQLKLSRTQHWCSVTNQSKMNICTSKNFLFSPFQT